MARNFRCKFQYEIGIITDNKEKANANFNKNWLSFEEAKVANVISMTREPSNQRRRLEQQWNSVNDTYQLTAERLKRLRKDLAIETDTNKRFQLGQNIETEETELDRLENKLRQIERQFNNRIASLFHITSRLLVRATSH